MAYVLVSPPAVEPVTVEPAKLHLRVDGNDEDALITTMIAAARRHAEMLTGRSFITQTWRRVLDCFPPRIELERGPVQSITSIVYRDMAGATQTIAWDPVTDSVQRSSDGTLVALLSDPLPVIQPAFGSTWPIAMPEAGAIAVNFIAGYGDEADDIPEGIRHWMLLRVGTMYENRQEVVTGTIVQRIDYLDTLLEPYTVALP